MSRSSTTGCLAAAATSSKSSGGSFSRSSSTVLTTSRVESPVDPTQLKSPRPSQARHPPGLPVRVAARPVRGPLSVDDELAGAAPIDVDRRRVVAPRAEQDAGEANLAAGLGADSNGDLVESLAAAGLGVNVTAECSGDRGGEVASGKLLGALVERDVPVGDIDRLVRHVGIVTPCRSSNYTWEYTYMPFDVNHPTSPTRSSRVRRRIRWPSRGWRSG